MGNKLTKCWAAGDTTICPGVHRTDIRNHYADLIACVYGDYRAQARFRAVFIAECLNWLDTHLLAEDSIIAVEDIEVLEIKAAIRA